MARELFRSFLHKICSFEERNDYVSFKRNVDMTSSHTFSEKNLRRGICLALKKIALI
jgi:hypothetical protein